MSVERPWPPTHIFLQLWMSLCYLLYKTKQKDAVAYQVVFGSVPRQINRPVLAQLLENLVSCERMQFALQFSPYEMYSLKPFLQSVGIKVYLNVLCGCRYPHSE